MPDIPEPKNSISPESARSHPPEVDHEVVDRDATATRRLLEVMAQLRHPERGCPWDLEQDHRSIRPYLLEETYEVLEAIDTGDDEAFVEELGDLLLQVVFHAQMARDRGAFGFEEVAEGIASKLEERHPHIFGEVEVEDSREVLRNWEEIKVRKKKRESKLDGVPGALCALTRAARIQEKAGSVGFDWDRAEEVSEKIVEEASEFGRAVGEGQVRAEAEFGDLLFSLVNWARKSKLDPEAALRGATARFETRFRSMEKRSELPLKGLSMQELDALWEQAKERAGDRDRG